MIQTIPDLFESARTALEKHETELASELLNEILKLDFEHEASWRLLHAYFGQGQDYQQFRKRYSEQHYPEQTDRGLNQDTQPAPTRLPAMRIHQDDGNLRRVNIPEGESSQVGMFHTRQVPPAAPLPAVKKLDPEAFPLASEVIEDEREKPAGKPKKPKKPKKTKGFFYRLSQFFWRKRKKPARKRSVKDQESASVRTITPLVPPETSPTRSDPPTADDESRIPTREPVESLPEIPPYEFGRNLRPDQKIKVLIVDDIFHTRDNLRRLLSIEPRMQVVGMASSGKEGIRLAMQTQPDVVLMDINMPDMDGIEATRLVRENSPASQVVMLTIQDDPAYMREAIIVGARDFLIKPPTIDDLLEAVEQAFIIGQAEREKYASLELASRSDASLTRTPRQSRNVISIYSPKGGVGCTTLAVNLAIALHSDESEVALVDSRLEFGGAAMFFNERPDNTISDLAPRVGELEPEIVDSVVVRHAESGVRILSAPRHPRNAVFVTGEQVSDLLTYFKTLWPYTIVDTGSALTETTLSVLDASDLIILVTTQEIPSLHKTIQFLEVFPRLGLSEKKIFLVINQYHSKLRITPERIGQNFKRHVEAVIPFDYRVVIPSVNRGSPFYLHPKAKKLPISQAVRALAEKVREQLTYEAIVSKI